ncbi:AI-2E family transporter [Accumulibacter sp.]|uniref:AI-2E family transporter n=1 Tax=Accumulibacter sp. TaxID=2053492 RepID=UPI0028C50A9E|nr:AI-2E family transporter [Accumulibacter sp.]
MSSPQRASIHEWAAWILALLAMLTIIQVRLLPALIAGLLVYQLVHVLAPFFAQHLSSSRAREIAVGLLALLVCGAVTAAVFGIIAFMSSEHGSLAALLAKMAEIIEGSRAAMPTWLAEILPSGSEAIRERAGHWLREHSSDLQVIGKESTHLLVHLLIGMIIGAMASLREAADPESMGPLARALAERVFRLGEAFRRVVFAQVRISALNTVFTALYLAVVLPLFGVHLPLTKTMILVTFIAGLLPVVGNLISNSVIFVVSLAHSPGVAMSSLAFLVLIHKLEYFLNARIVGAEIRAKAWELLTAMLVMESIFGLAGLAAAPICYAWLKDELASRELI